MLPANNALPARLGRISHVQYWLLSIGGLSEFQTKEALAGFYASD
jgi:hypothetical protein